MSDTVGIIGAGTMGAGIAQVAATHGWTVLLRDVDETLVRTAIAGIEQRLERLVEKQRLTEGERAAAAGRLRAAGGDASFAECGLVIEAVVENLDVKAQALGSLIPDLDPGAIIATNTSSLSVTEIGAAIDEPARTVGMHFFNPAPLLALVEIVAGLDTDPAVADRAAAIATAWGKRVARAADVPGFIVNHVARPYYLEALRILEDGYAGVADIDGAMTRRGGFRMGPLALTDLIGQDINAATTRSVWEQLERPPLLAPSRLQEGLVAAGHLGRKTGRGVYEYGEMESVPAVVAERRLLDASPTLRESVAQFAEAATGAPVPEMEAYVLARVLGALIVQAVHARDRGVADAADIDTALRYGTNYPKGPFAWLAQIGAERTAALLDALCTHVGDDRFAPPATLAEAAAEIVRAQN